MISSLDLLYLCSLTVGRSLGAGTFRRSVNSWSAALNSNSWLTENASGYTELLNTDATVYGGSGLGNAGGVYSQTGVCHGQNQHISLTLPPLSMLVLKPVTGAKLKA